MRHELVCQDCGESFEWHTIHKKLCPRCASAHRLQDKIRFRLSPKGQLLHDKWKERRRKRYQEFAKAPPRTCPDCGGWMDKRSEYTCKPCYIKRINNRKPEDAPQWRGGRYTEKTSGYVWIRRPNHPKANKHGYILEHRVIWEITHDKYLPDGWIVHHLNGIRHDNRPSNLVAMSTKKHSLVLSAKSKRIQELEALLLAQGVLL